MTNGECGDGGVDMVTIESLDKLILAVLRPLKSVYRLKFLLFTLTSFWQFKKGD